MTCNTCGYDLDPDQFRTFIAQPSGKRLHRRTCRACERELANARQRKKAALRIQANVVEERRLRAAAHVERKQAERRLDRSAAAELQRARIRMERGL